MIAVCEGCGTAAFPRPLLCRACGGAAFREEPSADGTVEEATRLHRSPGRSHEPPVALGSVRTDAGPVVVARLAGGPEPGSRVRLELDDGAPVAHLVD